MNATHASLKKLSLESLKSLRSLISLEIESRTINAIREGGYAQFNGGSRRAGGKVYIRVERINMRSVSGREVDPKTLRLLPTTWRVGIAALSPFTPEALRDQ